MVKSTPINQLPISQNQQQHITTQNNNTFNQTEEINIEDLVQEKERIEYSQQQDNLQDQINNLKQEIEKRKHDNDDHKENINPHPLQNNNPINVFDKNGHDSIINKNMIQCIYEYIDIKIFVIVFIFSLVIFSKTINMFFFNKLEIKDLGYLTSYIQSLIMSISIMCIMKFLQVDKKIYI